MKILSIANKKGGVGKTTVSLNLAYELSRRGYLVLVIDLDEQCDTTGTLLKDCEWEAQTIYQLLTGQCNPEDAILEVYDNLYLIPGSEHINHFGYKKSEMLLKRLLTKTYYENFDIVIIDNPPGTSEVLLLGYVAASHVLIVTEPEQFSMNNMEKLLKSITHIKSTMNPELEVLGLVANKVDFRRNLTKNMLNELKKEYSGYLLDSYLGINTAVPNSQRQGKTVREMEWYSTIVPQIRSLTTEIEERIGLTNGDGQVNREHQ